MTKFKRAVLYARYSSDNQRSESIDAQIRAMRKYCSDNSLQIVNVYTDEAISGTSVSKRKAFLEMIDDSSKGTFDVVLVHKLDRFARNRYDSAIYKAKLKKNNVEVYSVLEQLNGSPESIMLEAMLEGMSEYYSKNLAREVMKGMRENALQCKHTGGTPPLGYDLDENKHLIINDSEAEAVKLIFDLYNKGHGYSYIIDQLTEKGFRTKKGKYFGKNSLYSILSNEKYAGIYVYNKSESKDARNRRNSHKYKPDDDIIRVEGGCPAIISKEAFEKATERMIANKGKGGRLNSSEVYLLSGKICCGKCGKAMVGNVRHSGRSKLKLATYRCMTRKQHCGCKEINKEYMDRYVVDLMEKNLFCRKGAKAIEKRINRFVDKYNSSKEQEDSITAEKLASVSESIINLTKVIEHGTITDEIINRLNELEEEKEQIISQSEHMSSIEHISSENLDSIISEYRSLAPMSAEYREFVQKYIGKIKVYPFHVEITIKTGLGVIDELDTTFSCRRSEIYQAFDSYVREGA